MPTPGRQLAQTAVKIHANRRDAVRKGQSIWALTAMVALICLNGSLTLAQDDVLTQHNDVSRTGQDLKETWLTPANVNVNQFGKLFTQSVDEIIVGQPLYASGVLMNDGLVHNVVYVATLANTVYAFDADNNLGANAAPLWSASLNDGGVPDPISDYGCTGTHFKEIGVTSTPVIDAAKTTLYVVAKTLTGDVRAFNLHALDIRTGAEVLGGPTRISGTYGSSQTFNELYQMQRPALLLENGLIYVGFGGNGCDVHPYNGWLFAYDAQTLQPQAVFEVSPNGKKSALWQGGTGPAADVFGNVYVATANGTYDGPEVGNDYGDSVLKLGWNGTTFGVQDYFTPYNQAYLQDNDLDLGSAGALLLPDQPGLYPHELVAGGKQGTLYLLNRDNLGQFNPNTDDVIQTIPGFPFELSGIPSYWNGSVYVAGDHDDIKQFPLISGTLTPQPVSQTTVAFGGAGAGSTSITSNGTNNGILWALAHSSHILYAFDATNLAVQLYSSKQALHGRDALDLLIRFATPTVSNGKVYVGGRSSLTVYGLLPALSPAGGDNQTGTRNEVLPVALSVRASEAYAGSPIPGLSVTCGDGKSKGVFIPSATQTTDATGTATFQYQLPQSTGVVTITCSNPTTSSTTFTETCAPGAPAKVAIVSGNKQTGPPNTPLPNPLVVKVLDANGIVVPGATVTFTDNGAGGSFSPMSPVTDSKGRASTQYATGPQTGKVTAIASAPGATSASFLETIQW
jgi:Bacterial Ig-like domain (group 1)